MSPTAPLNRGFLFISGDDTDYHCGGDSSCFGNPQLNVLMQNVFTQALTVSGVKGATKDILAFGLQPNATDFGCDGNATAYLSFMYWLSLVGNYTYDIVTDATTAASVDFTQYKMIYLPSQKAVAQCARTTANGVVSFPYTLCGIESVLAVRKWDVETYVNSFGGSIVALEQSVSA